MMYLRYLNQAFSKSTDHSPKGYFAQKCRFDFMVFKAEGLG